MTCAAMLKASLWTRIAPSTERSASRLCGSVRSAAATAMSAIVQTTPSNLWNAERLQAGQRLLHLGVIGLVARILEHLLVPHDAAAIDDEHRPVGQILQADHVGVQDAV